MRLRLPLITLVVSFFILSVVILSVTAYASQDFYVCDAVGNPRLKMSLAATPQSVSVLIDNGGKIISDNAKFAYYDGADNQDLLMAGFKNWVSLVQGANAYSGYMYVPGSLFKTGHAQVGLYRSYYRSEKDCGNESQWFDCARD